MAISIIEDPLEEDVVGAFRDYGFNLKNDLKNVQMSMKEFDRILRDLSLDINSTPIRGNKINVKDSISVYKMRYKDEKRSLGSSSGYRLLSLINTKQEMCIPFHLYHKKSGKKPKLDLTEEEKMKIKRMISDISS